MRQLIIGTLISMQFVVSGCSDRGDAQPLAPRLTIEAQQVESPTIAQRKFLPIPGRYLHGKFTIRTAAAGELGIISSGTGGACLVAQLPAEKSCRLDSECNMTLSSKGGPLAVPKTWHGYCVAADAYGEHQGQCYVKPSDDYCLKGKTVGVGVHYTPFVDVSEVYAQAKAKRVKWIMLGCLNGVTDDGSAPCAAGEKMHDRGPYSELP